MNIINFLKDIRISVINYGILKLDIKRYKNVYAGSKQSKSKGDTSARDILVYCHVVEKGLSHKILKPLFGYNKVSQISKLLIDYCEKGGNDPYIISTAVSTLKEYNRVNSELGVPNDKLVQIPSGFNEYETINIGIDEFNPNIEYDFNDGVFSEFISKRHSIRLYDFKSLKIPTNDIIECIEVAQKSPSACNRQAVRVKIINDRETIAKISKIQGGANGFGENSGAMVIITSDIRLYEPSERRIPMFDCGLFTMNLLFALMEKKISTCVLNGSFTPEREKKMRNTVPIPNYEMYAAVIALSKIPDNEKVSVARSCKRNVEQIITII